MNVKNLLPIIIIISGLLISGVVLAQTPSDITYPIPELGNCENQTACKSYCDNSDHTEECLEFAKNHNMMSEEEVNQARVMTQAIKQGGPGGCQSKSECQAYCEHTDHLEECLSFAEKHKFIPEDEIEKVKAMVEAHKRGVTPPGNCETKTECEAYCEKPSHIEECLNYAEEAGFTPPGDVDKARRIVRLMNLGKTPGGCQSKEECETYCDNKDHREECVEFAVDIGEMTEEEAKKVRQGPPEAKDGPGGCQSEEECNKYCNAPEHQRECLLFAKEHGLMTEEETKMIEQDLAQLKAGIEEATPEATECIKNNLGEDVVKKIKDGTYTPGPQTGNKIRQCMQQFEEKMAQELAESLKSAPESVTSCLKNKLGQEGLNSLKQGNLPKSREEGNAIDTCFQQMEDQMKDQMTEEDMEEGLERLQESLNNTTPEVINCLNQIKSNFVNQVKNGEYIPTPQDGEKIMQCFEKYAPEEMMGSPEDQKQGMGAKSEEEIIEGILNNIPEEAKDCIKNNISQSIINKIKGGEKPDQELKQIMENCSISFPDQKPPEEFDKKEPPEGEMFDKKEPPEEGMFDKKEPPPEEMMKDKMPPPEDKPLPEEN